MLSSVLKKKKAMEGYHPKFDNEDNDPLRNASGERSYASQGGGAEEYSELRTMLNKKKERERKQREEAEAVRKKQRTKSIRKKKKAELIGIMLKISMMNSMIGRLSKIIRRKS